MMELGIFAKTFRRSDAQTTLEAVRALGLGCVQFNFEEYFRLLHSAGFRGPVIMHGFEENRAAESTAFARAKRVRAKLKTQTDHASH